MKTLFQKTLPAFLIIIFFFLAASIYSKFGNPLPFSINSTVTNKTDVFTVTGEGTVSIQPDIAYIDAGINQSASTVKQAQTKINEVINKITTGLKSLGIDSKDIKTTSYSINPTYDWSSSTQRITGYSAATQLNIKITDIDKVNDVIDSATTNGANQVSGITFDVEDKQTAQNSARQQAVDEATATAQAAAKIAGFKLGKIIGYSENSNDNLFRPVAYTKTMSADEAVGGGTEIQTGSEDIKITVSLSYQIN
jgi:uncharacterized protein